MFKRFFSSSWKWMTSHKKTSIAFLVVLVAAGYGVSRSMASTDAQVRYVFATAKTGSIDSAVTGSGQVAADQQEDVKSEVSGDITDVRVTAGDTVKSGQVLAVIDSKAAEKQVANAEITVANAQISYSKALKAYQNQSATSTISDINIAHQNGYKAIEDAYIDMPSMFMQVGNLFYDPIDYPDFSDTNIVSASNWVALDYKHQAGLSFDKAKTAYDTEYNTYKSLSVDSDEAQIVDMLEKTRDILTDLSSGLTGAYGTIDYMNSKMASGLSSELLSDKSMLNSYINSVNSHINAMSDALTKIEDAKDGAASAEISLKSAQLSLNNAEDALDDAREALANHAVTAPYDGVIAEVPVRVGDKASSGTTIANIVTEKKIVAITLNEIDAAKIKVGQAATLTFDAIDGVTIPGTVTHIDIVGTVNQGVVSYGVEISIDSDDARIRDGMTVSVDIAVASKEGVISVPVSAVSEVNGKSYIMVSDASDNPVMREVGVGLETDNTVEITSGLAEGERYVARTITVTQSSATAQTGSAFNVLSGQGTRTGTVRMTSGNASFTGGTTGSFNRTTRTGN